MAKKIKYIFLLIIFLTIGICTHSFARITTNDPTVNSGGTVTITVNSKEPVASGAIKISSNDGLIFKSASGGTVNGDLVAFSKTNNVTSGIATYTFTAPEVSETRTYKVVFSSQDMADEEGKPVDPSNATATVTVKALNTTPKPDPEPQPEDPKPEPPTPAKATMTKVQVGDKTYTKTDFTVKVANDVTSIKVVPTISNGESYTINGGTSNDVKLEEGTNTVRIKLASGNLYKIYIRREAKEDDTPNIIDDPEKDPEVKVGLKSLLIKGVTQEGETIELSYAPEFFSEIYEYQMLLDETLSNITKLDVEAVGLQKDFTIEIKGNEELKEGENIITILVKSKDGKTSATYTIVVTKEAKAEEVIAPVDNTEETRKPLWNTTQKIVITVFTSIVAILGIIFAVVEYRYQKKHKQGKEEVEEENKKEEAEEEVKYSAISLEEESKEEISGDVPFAKIGFENEVDKVDVLKDEQEVKFQEIEEENSEVEEELKKQTKSKKGKHF